MQPLEKSAEDSIIHERNRADKERQVSPAMILLAMVTMPTLIESINKQRVELISLLSAAT
jgi:hypothetical protein